MELQEHLAQIRAQGLGVAAISYDPEPVLAAFAARRGIEFPLLSDKGSAIIRKFGILNQAVPPGTPFYGIPHPVTLIVDPQGRVVSKYAEADDTERHTTGEILVRQFGAQAGAGVSRTETKHLAVTSASSAARLAPGQHAVLSLDIQLKQAMHVYAPGVQGYIPLEWKLAPANGVATRDAEFPKAQLLRLEVIGETVPVYTGHFRVLREITIGSKTGPGPLTVEGTLRYQACDDKLCYIPQTVPLKWTIDVELQDRQRVGK